ncbi:MAG: hypothetical protein KJO96_06045, partial [Winogradskyella sp.]|nr:hypothetical protein [Winogradskyella sp.]
MKGLLPKSSLNIHHVCKGIKVACVLFIFTLATANAQTIKVLEAGSNEPISGVLISKKNKSKTVITNFNGEADLDKFEDNEVIFFENLIYNSAQSTKAVLQSSNNQIFLTLSIEGLNEVVISVSKFEQSKRDIPQ